MPTEATVSPFRIDPDSPAGRALARAREPVPDAWRRTVTVLGSTGTIGTNALAVMRLHAARFAVDTLAAGTRIRELAAQVLEFHPAHAVVATDAGRDELLRLTDLPRAAVGVGREALAAAAARAADVVLHGVSGAAGLPA